MHVTCELHGTVRDAVGEKRLHREIQEGTTIQAFVGALDDEHGGLEPLVFDGDGRFRPNVNVVLNGDFIRDPERVLTDGDTLILVPSVAGG